MTPQCKATIITLLGPLFHPAHFVYLLIDDMQSWKSYPDWVLSFRPGYSFLKKPMPWLPFVATNWLNMYLRTDMKVFEYGSGASTIFMAERAGEVFTVEHDKQWYAEVSNALRQRGVTNCVYQLREPSFHQEGPCFASGDCVRTLIADPSERENPGVHFDSYIATIDTHPAETFDLVLVDGRARHACIRRAVPKIKKGGYLMLDNANDSRLVDCLELMRSYRRSDLQGIAPGWPPARWTTSVWEIT
jgi:hypothetical protein